MSTKKERQETAALYAKMRIVEKACEGDVVQEAFNKGMRWGLHNALGIVGVHVWELADAADEWAMQHCVPSCGGCEHPRLCEMAGEEIAQRLVEQFRRKIISDLPEYKAASWG